MSRKLVSIHKQALTETKSQGHETVSIDAMENYLTLFEKDLEQENYYNSLDHELKLAKFQVENDQYIAHTNNQTIHAAEMFKAVITAGQSALKASMIINGGAAVALLAFAGRIWETTTSETVASSLTNGIIFFCFGVLIAAISTGTTYLSQLAFSLEWLGVGRSFNIISIALVFFSYVLFGAGSIVAVTSLGHHLGL